METIVRKPTHPGFIFKRRILDRLEMTITQAAKYLGVSRVTMSNFCNGKSPCTHELARRIAEATGSNVAVWINMQANLDTWEAEHMAKPSVTKFPVQAA